GEFVLYWMHHGARAEENPALDVATVAAAALRKPLLVYQGLGGHHRFDSDRHHTFIMEGARDVNAALDERGVRHAFYLPRAG
ncbi:MAG: deoxyribodipyrimidine photolyase, partial [Gammaproteobacteria bacterium]|nr:deoxyribodipyrimidine photolyase [Gammaproteobacteria bacterium]